MERACFVLEQSISGRVIHELFEAIASSMRVHGAICYCVWLPKPIQDPSCTSPRRKSRRGNLGLLYWSGTA